MKPSFRRRLLLSGAIFAGAALHPGLAFAQAPDGSSDGEGEDSVIVVTGSLFARDIDESLSSPLTTLSAETLEQRGFNSVSDALRSLSVDNSGSIPTAFTGGFASGASGVSLRGLGVNSTLVLFDGLRGANYPLADDGQRSFVDLNTIPQFAVERVEVLRDGASATYGADAVGGVVNIITRRSFSGISAGAEAGLTQRGDVDNQRLWLMAGTGDLDADRYNVWLGGEYQRSSALAARDRGFPYNTLDLSSLDCGTDAGPEACANGNSGAYGPAQTISALVQRARQLIPGNVYSGEALPGAHYQVLNPAGCAPGTMGHNDGDISWCEQDKVAAYGELQPRQERVGITGRITGKLSDTLEAYAIGTYYQSIVETLGQPSVLRSSAPVNTTGLILPALLSNGQLNPNNPFAADGDAAQIMYAFGDIPASSTTKSRTYRGAAGLSGEIGEKGRFSFDVTAMHTDLDWTRRGAINAVALGKAVADGTYNFVNPQLNSDAVRSSIAPDILTRSTSDLYMAQLTGAYAVAELPGGPLQLGGTLSLRHERLNAPSANPNLESIRVNPVNARGHRTISAASLEIQAPVAKAVEFNLAARYDHYSDGYDRLSPKVGVKVEPVTGLTLRGTYSQGFRAPQFAELNGSFIGYVTAPGLPCDIVIAHGGTDLGNGECSGGSPYVRPGNSLGINATGTPTLKPERARSWTLGAVFEPTSWFTATIDYYNISKKDFIASGPDYGAALSAYYAGQPLPAGYTVTLNEVDPLHPDAPRTVGIVNVSYVNASEQRTSGIDFTATAKVRLSNSLRLTSRVEATRILNFDLVTAGGIQKFVGTQGPYNISSGAGTPAWRGTWQNTLEYGPASLTLTAQYTSGYLNTAEDITGPGSKDDCDNALAYAAFCRTDAFLVFDLVGSYEVSKQATVYVNVSNLFDAKAPINLPNYASYNYNPTWSQSGVIGRSFRIGTKFHF